MATPAMEAAMIGSMYSLRENGAQHGFRGFPLRLSTLQGSTGSSNFRRGVKRHQARRTIIYINAGLGRLGWGSQRSAWLQKVESNLSKSQYGQSLSRRSYFINLFSIGFLQCHWWSSLFVFRVLNNYLVWQTVRTLSSTLSRAFRDAYKGLRKAMLGSEGGEEPWRACVADTNGVLGFATGAMFVRDSHFRKMSKQRVSLLLPPLQQTLRLRVCHFGNWLWEGS